MKKSLQKSLNEVKLQNLISNFKGILIDQTINDTPRRVADFHYCKSSTKVRQQPKLVGVSKPMVEEFDWDYESIIKSNNQSALYLSGSRAFTGSEVLCNNYCGFQFGSWAGQLGDGRAHTIGNIVTPKTELKSSSIYELQLKGSGMSPFSRRADGNSVVSSALREFLASELMWGLGVPTTRAASLVIANENVVRDPFYDGNLKVENAAIVLRVCDSFLRFGSVQVCLKNASMVKQQPLENRKILQPLFDYLIENCYSRDIDPQECDPYEAVYQKIVERSAELVAYWQSIGFVHGVLNTDNMSLVNKTIDYGPFAFIDYFSKDFISNQTDEHERYSYRRQPQIVKWNLNKLAEAMDYLIPANVLKKRLQDFDKFYEKKYEELMVKKLGLPLNSSNEANQKVISSLFQVMHISSSHFTNTFRILEKQFGVQSQEQSQKERSVDSSTKQKIVQELVNESCPTQFYVKNVRAFPTLIGRPYEEILKHDDGFNIYFIKEQKERVETAQMLYRQTSEERRTREAKLWLEWIDLYVQQKPLIEKGSNPKYVLLNETAKMINAELLKIESAEKQVEFLERVLGVFFKPCQRNEWFEENFWKRRPVPVKLTCSS